jgi:hypothetical protein
VHLSFIAKMKFLIAILVLVFATASEQMLIKKIKRISLQLDGEAIYKAIEADVQLWSSGILSEKDKIKETTRTAERKNAAIGHVLKMLEFNRKVNFNHVFLLIKNDMHLFDIKEFIEFGHNNGLNVDLIEINEAVLVAKSKDVDMSHVKHLYELSVHQKIPFSKVIEELNEGISPSKIKKNLNQKNY